VNPLGEYRGRHGIYQAEGHAEQGSEDSPVALRLGSSGAIVYVGGEWGATRPVTDSFTLVQVGTLEGIDVQHNNRSVGHTDSNGRLFLPELSSYYENHIAIDDRAIPIDHTLAATHYILTPDWRSGSCLYFAATAFRPLIGRVAAAEGDKLLALEYRELTLHLEGRSIVLPTGRGGEFYLDPQDPRLRHPDQRHSPTDCTQLAAATESKAAIAYDASIEYNGTTFRFPLVPPAGNDFFADLGTIIVNRPGSVAGDAP
jgi:outer membrane usher protein FimD/PapC